MSNEATLRHEVENQARTSQPKRTTERNARDLKLFTLKRFYPALILALSFSTLELTASAAPAQSSWSNRPSWAANLPDDNVAQKRAQQRERERKLEPDTISSPFTPGSNNLSLDVGQVFLTGDLGETYGDAIGTQLHYTYGVSEMFGFDSNFSYSSHGDGRYSLANLGAGLRMNLSWFDKVIPHVIFGLGFYKPSYDLTDELSISPVVFGLHAGPGVNLEITKQLYFGASLTFHDIFGSFKRLPDGGTKEINGTYFAFLLSAGFTF
jgi:hypothetical protein